MSDAKIFRRRIALPGEHGAWVFLLSPLLIGFAVGGGWNRASGVLVVAALMAFLLRQPAMVAVKAYSGRRSRSDLPAARFWMGVYTGVGLVALAWLVQLGYGYLLALAIPGTGVFAWHLYLVARREERRQIGLDVVGSGTLALAAPAALWVSVGGTDSLGWWLWGLTWLQSAASIVYAFLRLEQRELTAAPALPARLGMGRRALLYSSFNLALSAALSWLGSFPPLLPLPYALQWAECLWGTLRPALEKRPTAIGIRQLIVSSLFTLLFILVWRI